jgi:enoyl-[acyl-carrier protein] reductase I
LDGKKLVVTGVLTEASVAYGIAKEAHANGAELVLTGAGRGTSVTRRAAKKLSSEIQVLEMDVTSPEQLRAAGDVLADRWDTLDGIVHAVAFAPPVCMGGSMFDARWSDVAVAMEVSAFSLKAVVEPFLPLLIAAGQNGGSGASVVGVDFDASVAWPSYNWMGVAKGAYESLARYLARDLGPDRVRVNLVAAGPISTISAKSIPGFDAFEQAWDASSPLPWNARSAQAAAKACVALLSDQFLMTTGEIIHVDGGMHAIASGVARDAGAPSVG